MKAARHLTWPNVVGLFQGAVGLGTLTWAATGTLAQVCGWPLVGPVLNGAFLAGALAGAIWAAALIRRS
jgi:hypothetical protein